ncbi:kinesin motor domain protein [Ancylostoma ceylanicum]|uniref:Kinesin-like protein n=1 Tax=Ancylostoma ceylanicum TaxID=53326 RepID=A0A0D6LMY2_9BILA|nr:kinesin motor domain protein [Ancylostoma ceylanicum]
MTDDIPVKVFVRSRPFSDKEKLENAQECLQFFVESNQISCNGKTFTFDGVLDPTTPQDTVYDVTASSLLEQFFKGFNCTVLAYGQTGSGKTYTMGTEETTVSMQSDKRGIIPRLVDALFRQISESGAEIKFQVFVSMLEIYDEKVHDLLSPSREPLQVREQGGAVFVQGLSKCRVQNLAQTMSQLEKGGLLRSKGETAMNAQSSRSHAIFTISLEKVENGDEENGFTAKLHLVDLAGSERLKKTQAEGARKMEGIRINEGLLALGNVISALSEQGGNRHIPYRDSKITRLLQVFLNFPTNYAFFSKDSLGGNSYTLMIACVSPADSNAEETLSTLRYADRAKKIKNKPVVNIDPGQQKIRELKEKDGDPSMAKVLHGDTDDEVLDETVCLKFVDQQAFLNKELEDVMRQIKDKEDILTKAVENQKNVDELMKKHKYVYLISHFLLLCYLLRLAEERRRKLQDMEKQLAQFRKQMNEMKKLERQRQQSEETQKRMQAEIVELKKAKVRMVKQQKEEAEKYRHWKIKHDRELHQLKQKERKRDIEAAREKRVHDQQMLVYKQKLEDASKVNKRLQAQMERAAVFSREKPESEKSLSNAKQFIEAELALVGSSYEAELMCQSLKDQRRQLGRKKARLQRQRESIQSPDEPLPKRRSTEQGPALSPEDEETLNKIDEELKNIDQQQILCSDELNKLQRGCGSIDVDSRSETRWKDLYTVAAARIYLKVLFEQAANERRTIIDQEKEMKGLQRKNKELESYIRDLKKRHEDQVREMHEKNRKLAMEYDKEKSEAEMHFLNLMARMNTCSMVDEDVLREFKRLCENFEHASRIRNQVKTTKVKNPIKEVEPDSEEEESIMDSSYHPHERASHHHHEKKKKRLTLVYAQSSIDQEVYD